MPIVWPKKTKTTNSSASAFQVQIGADKVLVPAIGGDEDDEDGNDEGAD